MNISILSWPIWAEHFKYLNTCISNPEYMNKQKREAIIPNKNHAQCWTPTTVYHKYNLKKIIPVKRTRNFASVKKCNRNHLINPCVVRRVKQVTVQNLYGNQLRFRHMQVCFFKGDKSPYQCHWHVNIYSVSFNFPKTGTCSCIAILHVFRRP